MTLRRRSVVLAALAVAVPLGDGRAAPVGAYTPLDPAAMTAKAGPQAVACPAGAIGVPPGASIQAAVDKAPQGAVFCIGAGVHRGEVIAPKDGQRFYGEAGAVLNGTRILTGFRRAGGLWVAPGAAPVFEPHGECLANHPACDRPDAVFVDGRPLEQVLDRAALRPGRFMIDPKSRRIELAEDPSGHTVELAVAGSAFLANHAKNVVVANLVIEKYASPAQHGAVFDDTVEDATGWLIEHDTVRLNSGLGILAGPASVVRDNVVSDNGQLGISFSSDHVRIEGNVIARNNTRGFDPAWEAGGLKGADAKNVFIAGNYVHDNAGPGLWCDIECLDILYEGNLVAFNRGPGIMHEISFRSIIRDNTLRLNGLDNGGWFWGAGILLSASENVLVERNSVVVPDDGTGIALVDQGRQRDGGGYYRTAGDTVRDNVVCFTGSSGRMGGVSDVSPGTPNAGIIRNGNNRFDGNLYLMPAGFQADFTWGRTGHDFAAFQGLGQDASSQTRTLSFLDDDCRDLPEVSAAQKG